METYCCQITKRDSEFKVIEVASSTIDTFEDIVFKFPNIRNCATVRMCQYLEAITFTIILKLFTYLGWLIETSSSTASF